MHSPALVVLVLVGALGGLVTPLTSLVWRRAQGLPVPPSLRRYALGAVCTACGMLLGAFVLWLGAPVATELWTEALAACLALLGMALAIQAVRSLRREERR